MIEINAIGDVCPLPVVKTKKALAEMASGQLKVLVDNEIAVQNVEKYVRSTSCTFTYGKQGDHYVILIGKDAPVDEASIGATDIAPAGKTVVVLSSSEMGDGDAELGQILMKGFVFALTQLDALPDTVLLYNSGAKLSVQGASTLNDLTALMQAGVRIMTCGTCLNHYGLTEQLAVGEVTNMYAIVEEMRQAGRILRP